MAEAKETVNQEVETVGQDTKTFTQAELDAIVQDRLARDRAKYADYDALKEKASKLDEMEESQKSELTKATERAEALQKQVEAMTAANQLREIREKVAKETGVPADILSGADEEACKKQAEAILAFAKPGTYPKVPDGGELDRTKQTSTSTKKQFADWFANN